MEELAKRLGFIIDDCDLTDKLLGVISLSPTPWSPVGFILLNSILKRTPLERDFTIAHEMGHYYCNHRGDGSLFAKEGSLKEWEADRFAWELFQRKYSILLGLPSPPVRLTGMIEVVNN